MALAKVMVPVAAFTSMTASVPEVLEATRSCAHASEAAPPSAGGNTRARAVLS